MPLVVVATVIGLGLAVPEEATRLRLEARGGAEGLVLSGPPGLAFAVLTSERPGAYVIAARPLVVMSVPIEGSVPVLSGTIPPSGEVAAGDLAASFPGRDVFVQAAAQTAGSGPEGMLVSNALVLARAGGAAPRYVSARRYALERNRAALVAALAAAAALSAALAVRRRPALDPRPWVAAAALAGAVAGAMTLGSTLPNPRDAFRSVEAKYADAFEPKFGSLVERMRGAESRSARALAVVPFGAAAELREILASRMLAPGLALDVRLELPSSVEGYGLVVVAGDAPAPPGLRETARGRRIAAYEPEPR